MIKSKKIYRDDIYITLQDENIDDARVIYLQEPRNDIKVGDYLIVQEKMIGNNDVGGNLGWFEYVVLEKENASAYVVKETTIYEE
jgi:hypothetical protein